jgi:RNase P subunit RPR2
MDTDEGDEAIVTQMLEEASEVSSSGENTKNGTEQEDLTEEQTSSVRGKAEKSESLHEHKWKPYYVIHTGLGKRKLPDDYEEFACSKCSLIAPTQEDVDEHEQKEHKIRPRVTCDECGKDFARKYELQTHVKVVHLGIKDQMCPHCDYVTSEKGRVKKHIQTVHNNVRNYQCQRCDYSAKNKSGLDNHVSSLRHFYYFGFFRNRS